MNQESHQQTYPTSNEITQMIEMFPNWASVFNVSPPKKQNNKQNFITTQQNNQYDVNDGDTSNKLLH